MLILWVVGGVIALCGALTLAELSAALPRIGRRLRLPVRGVRPAGGVPLGLGLVPDRLRRADRGLGVGLGEVSPRAAPSRRADRRDRPAGAGHRRRSSPSPRSTASGRRRTVRVQGGMTVVKLAILAVLAVAGLAAGWGRLGEPRATGRRSLASSLVTMASSLVYISYAYTGWNAASYLAGEVDRPAAAAAPGDPARDGPGARALPGSERRLRPGASRPPRSGGSSRPREHPGCRRRRADRPDRRRSALRPAGRRSALGRDRADAAGLGQRLRPDRPAGRLRDGPGRPIPRVAGRLSPRWGTPAIATALAGRPGRWCCSGPARSRRS